MQASITSETWNVLIRNPQNRIEEAIRPVVESLGGKVESAFPSFGEFDTVTIIKMPDSVTTAAINKAGFSVSEIQLPMTGITFVNMLMYSSPS